MTIFEISLVMFMATVVRSAFGFGEALVSVPILALFIPVSVAAPVAVFASVVIAFIVILQDWRHVHFHSARWLVLSTLVGIPLGLLVLKTAPERWVKGGLAAMIISFSAYSLWRPQTGKWDHDRFAWVFGFLAGIFGGAYGLNGPPLAVYGDLRGWRPVQFRATLQGYFLPASLVGMTGYIMTGLWTHAVFRFSLWSLPAILMGIPIGRLINQRLGGRRFIQVLHLGLVLLGMGLLVQAGLS